ncbi:endonuclease/exonuclease/phosphatase family protein [Sphingomonas sp. CV7422]|uniref:endonuclease/exonuclease/phosphatase family protein n=1 Tax=Sphingomonas sp. CV7422 TaxID=3018036 RepID=UPI0022FE64FB|nr:endonuclease/exonuclease/phosphatase family protein [Sphingomonas sp. CV7422]
MKRPSISPLTAKLTPSATRRATAQHIACALLLLVTGCTKLPAAKLASGAAPIPAESNVVHSADGAEASTTLEVLTFNIEGLGWPARRGRASSLKQIGATLADLNARGKAPDVILVQEMFSAAAVKAMTQAGYPYRAWGPTRTRRSRLTATDRMRGPKLWRKGETGFHLVGSGLAVLSRYPIIASESEPFGKNRCAGFDCLSNKGIQHVRIAVPGVSQPIDIFNTHLNSQKASRVPPERHGAAHALQVNELARFVAAKSAPRAPGIFGGDFNMRGASDRLAHFEASLSGFTMVHRYCAAPNAACEVAASWDGDEPWLDTEDLQLFSSGAAVTVRPTKVEAMFDAPASGDRLSDHDGLKVAYRLAWQSTRGTVESNKIVESCALHLQRW